MTIRSPQVQVTSIERQASLIPEARARLEDAVDFCDYFIEEHHRIIAGWRERLRKRAELQAYFGPEVSASACNATCWVISHRSARSLGRQ
jgi:hypothetical protein